MTELKTEALVLRVWDYGETSQLARLLTPSEGVVSIVAKGIKGRRASVFPPLEPLTLISALLHRGKPEALILLKESETLERFPEIWKDTRRLAVAGLLAELCERTGEGGSEGGRVFDFLNKGLHLLEIETELNPLHLCCLLLIQFLDLAGLKPEVQKCIICGGSKELQGFAPQEGGALCKQCIAGYKGAVLSLDAGSLRVIRQIQNQGLQGLRRLRINRTQMERIISSFLSMVRYHLVNTELRSLRFFRITAFPQLRLEFV